MGGINGLQKMWRDRSQEEITNIISQELLPYVGTYADILMEGTFSYRLQKYLLAFYDLNSSTLVIFK